MHGLPAPRVGSGFAASCESNSLVEFASKAIAGIDELHKHLTGAQVRVHSTLTIVRHTEKLSLEIVPEESAAKDAN